MQPVVDSVVEITTPECIAFRHEIAGPFRRLPAFLVDVLVRLAGLLLIGLMLLLVSPVLRRFQFSAMALMMLLWFAAEWFYGGFFEVYWNGQTPGKRLFGLRVICVDGRPIVGMQAFLRNVLRAVDLMPLIPLAAGSAPDNLLVPSGLLGLCCAARTRHFQRLGDVVCGTMVVVEEPARVLGTGYRSPGELDALRRQVPPSFRADRSLAHALAMYYERRMNFPAVRRHEIARHLAEPLIERFELPPPTNYDDLLCVLYEQTFHPLAGGKVS